MVSSVFIPLIDRAASSHVSRGENDPSIASITIFKLFTGPTNFDASSCQRGHSPSILRKVEESVIHAAEK